MSTWFEDHRVLVAGAGAVVLALLVAIGVVLARDGDLPPVGSGPTTTAAPTASSTSPQPTTTAATSTTTSTTTTTTARPTTTTSAPPRTTTTRPTQTTRPPFPDSLRGKDVTAVPTSARVVALTFDAGANSAALPSILRTLAAQRVPATFFLTGTWAHNDPAGVRSIRAGGHRIGNHSMTHPRMTGLSDAAIGTELRRAQTAITAAGADPRPLFRFPYGDRDARTIAAVNDAGYAAVRWTVDTLGWKGTSGGMTAGKVTERVLGALQPGEIVLMHIGSNPDDGSTLDADALPGMITALRDRGYGFVTLDALLGRS